MSPRKFKQLVWAHYEQHGRHTLPWRKTTNPYRILVSEIMLQQTQVERVIGFYGLWLKKFPTVGALAKAPLADVLSTWQGLGYNRRAKGLWEAAKAVVAEHKGKIPEEVDALEKLPGIGPYTARALAAFAFNKDVIFIETNLRTAIIYHFFPGEELVDDAAIQAKLEKVHEKGRAREWYSALMDYGAHLKRSGIRTNVRVKSYKKQTVFEGSNRQARGAILRALNKGPMALEHLMLILGPKRKRQVVGQTARLFKEGMIEVRNKKYMLPK